MKFTTISNNKIHFFRKFKLRNLHKFRHQTLSRFFTGDEDPEISD